MFRFTVFVSVVAFAVASEVPPIPYAAASATSAVAAAPASAFPSSFSSDDLSGSYVHHFSHPSDGFNIQSGYEGYLVPSQATSQQATVFVPIRHGLDYITSSTGVARIFKFITSKGLQIIPKVALAVLGVAALLLVGCALTTAVCAFTPLCNISFVGWGVTRETMRSLITEDRVTATAAFVMDAIKKYKEMYGGDEAKPHVAKQ